MRVSIVLVLLALVTQAAADPPDSSAQERSRERALSGLDDVSRQFQALSERVEPAVVAILATGYQPLQQGDAPGSGLVTRRQAGGSGVIVDADGYVVTNLHVVEGASRIRVRLPIPVDADAPGRSVLKQLGKVVGAQVVGFDRETDLAVLKVAETGLPFLPLGDSDGVRTGQLVFAFGSPLGLENSVTMGIVSAVARQLRPEDPMIYIQTDATINPGSSGGPLVNAAGEIVGINTLILSQSGGSEGIGFAAPSNIVRNVYQQIKLNGYVRRGQIGVHAQTITPVLAEGLALGRQWGVVLGDVYPGGPAARAGLQIGDIVIGLDGKAMENGRQLDVNIYRAPVGSTVTLDVLRGQERLSVPVVVVERSDDINRFFPMVSPDQNLVPRLGMLGIELRPEIAAMIPGLRSQSGVVVAARAPDAVYGRVALAPGDVIVSVNGQAVANLGQLRAAIDRMKPSDSVVLQVERRGQLQFLAFELD
ncbi:MAG: trypsin-like peptidase domain-containing protein [Gemmatimonadota bacterium]|nr:MAG: trypsin-like peptidase domain-containing protein [Gemmatimonadota bacterium]